MAFCASAEDLYIGSFYVTTNSPSGGEERLLGETNDQWTNRRTVICDMFNFEQPDVLGIQSYTSTQLSFLTSRMRSYSIAGNIFYKKSEVQLDTCNVVENMPEGCTCTWAKFQKGEKTFYVFNICFATDAATTAASTVITAIKAINTEKLPCYIVGYLGVDETKNAYTKLKGGGNYSFLDTYEAATVRSAEYGTVNNFNLEENHNSSRYDFVFASKNTVTVKAYGQLQYGYYTLESDNSYKRRLPSAHFPVMAKTTL